MRYTNQINILMAAGGAVVVAYALLQTFATSPPPVELSPSISTRPAQGNERRGESRSLDMTQPPVQRPAGSARRPQATPRTPATQPAGGQLPSRAQPSPGAQRTPSNPFVAGQTQAPTRLPGSTPDSGQRPAQRTAPTRSGTIAPPAPPTGASERTAPARPPGASSEAQTRERQPQRPPGTSSRPGERPPL